MLKRLCVLLLLLPEMLFGGQDLGEMIQALEMAAYWDKKLYERFPVTFNHLLSAGYFVTHSARMSETGEIAFGAAHAPPYLNINWLVQPFHRLELSANYRIFRGCEDPVLGPHGFGDYADRGANFKYALFTPEESLYRYPGVAFGIDDFMGSKKFTTYYVVGTQVFRDWGLEASFGWGTGLYTKGPSKGFFGGVNWFPLWKEGSSKWTRGIALSAEYDPINYLKDPHPNGRVSHTPLNFGIKYSFCDLVELSAGSIRGEAFAAAGSLHFNWGTTEGFLPKVLDNLPYTSPIDTQPLGCYRPVDVMVQALNYTLEAQGFQLTRAWLEEPGRLRLVVVNCRYRQEHITRMRLQYLLASLTPSNISEVIVVIESYGLPCQQYTYTRELLLRSASHAISPYEFDILTPSEEVRPPLEGTLIFQRRSDLWQWRIGPRFETFLGSASGKFKYDAGLKGTLEGFLPYNWYYELQVSQTLISSHNKIGDFDLFHPSQLPNVATDYIRYRQGGAFTWDKLYLQKNWNWGRGCFSRISGGYFQVNYGGIAGELLWYPAQAYFAIGLEGAVVKKRSYRGLGFQSTLRHFEGRKPVYSHYSTLQQYFLNFYLDFPGQCIFTKISLGQFLARDKGARLEATRYFNNGLRLTGWITLTNACDIMHGEKYYDRGVAIEIPFDFFYRCSSRRVWNYATAAWLRDAGYTTTTGKSLFEILNRERRW